MGVPQGNISKKGAKVRAGGGLSRRVSISILIVNPKEKKAAGRDCSVCRVVVTSRHPKPTDQRATSAALNPGGGELDGAIKGRVIAHRKAAQKKYFSKKGKEHGCL